MCIGRNFLRSNISNILQLYFGTEAEKKNIRLLLYFAGMEGKKASVELIHSKAQDITDHVPQAHILQMHGELEYSRVELPRICCGQHN